jgi:NAD(P)-dependent dehydrogenase (short-subunit alcohol dehydrogenase family)
MGRLADRVAVVTGAGDGIGRGVVRRFAAEGARVLVAEIDERAGDSVAAELRDEFGADARSIRTDVRVKADVIAMIDRALAEWGTVDVLVNNAWGGGALGRVEHKSDAQMAHGFGVGFYGPLWAMQAAFPVMREQQRGNVVNLCSLNGVNAHVGTLEYNCAKEALRTLTRTAAREWAPHGIVVNAVCPGAKTAAFRALAETNPELVALADSANPMGRLGDPEADIAPVVVFLASDDASYLTGNTLFVDGGSHINGVPWVPDLADDA